MTPRAARARLPRSCWSPPTASTAAGSRASSRSTTRASTPAHRTRRRRRLRADAAVLPLRPALLGDRRRRPDRRADPRLPGLRLAAVPALDRPRRGADRRGARLLEPRRFGAPRRAPRSPRSPASTSAAGAGRAMMAFIWIALVYVIVAFADITAAQLRRRAPRSSGPARVGFHPGGAVAAASVLYLAALARARAGAALPRSRRSGW